MTRIETQVELMDSTPSGSGVSWLGWRPHLHGQWRLWRTGELPLEFTGTALTPRCCDYDPMPPDPDALVRAAGEEPRSYGGLVGLRWPFYGTSINDTDLCVDNDHHDGLVARTDGGNYVLGWSSDAIRRDPPPPGEVDETYPYPFRSSPPTPLRFVHNDGPDELRFNVKVFGSGGEARDWVVRSGDGRLSSGESRLLRWAVDLAAEFDPELDGPDAEQLA